MRAERRPDGSLVVRDDPRFLRVLLLAFGAAILAAVVSQSPREPLKLFLAALGSLLCFVPVSTLERVRFEFHAPSSTLRWSRRNLWRTLAGQVPFAEIERVDVRVREDRERDGGHVRIDPSWRIVLATRAGPLELANRPFPDEAAQTAIASAIRESLALAPAPPVPETLEDLVAGGDLVAAVRHTRTTRGLSLSEAKQLVDEIRAKAPTH